MSKQSESDPTSDIPPELISSRFVLSQVQGFERGPSVFRFDPSGILNINGVFHVYYTRFAPRDVFNDIFDLPNLTQIWLATSKDGWNWTEVGQVLPDTPETSWQCCGKHAAHVIDVDGTFYMYYTAHVGPTYFNKRIGLAVADDPAGPFRPLGHGPLLDAWEGYPAFDSVGQEDSCVLQRDGKFWWYFKGYGADPETGRPINNRLCLAVADSPVGPFTRCDENPVTKTHTGCLWNHGDGIAMVSDVVDTSPVHSYPPCIQYSKDGVHFQRGTSIQVTSDEPELDKALVLCAKHWGLELVDPGVYCPEISEPSIGGRGITWGLSQLPESLYASDPDHPQHTPFLVRFDCDLRAP